MQTVIYKKKNFLNDSKDLKIKIWLENIDKKKAYLARIISDNIKVNAVNYTIYR